MIPVVRSARGLLLLALAWPLSGCSGRPASSPAASDIIARAADDEERQALEQARDDIDAEMRAAAMAKDAEIERLREENETLRRRLDR